ncbi:MAG: 4Fe-4S binding protein [Desulfovibrionaceae bacterium]|nr:4Fe-4S binding protein [Desulfovibrionaceae bacterium]
MHEIVVLSGKGGTGKTTMTAALASVAKNALGQGARGIVVADCDVDAADLHLVLGQGSHGGAETLETHPFISGDLAFIDPERCVSCGECATACRFDAIDASCRVRPELCEGCGVCRYVCTVDAVRMEPRRCGEWYLTETRHGPMVHARLDIGAENSGKLVTTVRNRSREAAEARGLQMVLTDGPPGIGCPVIASLTNADLALLITEPTVTAIHDLKRVRSLAAHFKVPCLVLVNKADLNPQLADEIRVWCAESGVGLAGAFGYDPAFTRAQVLGKTVPEADPALAPAFEAVWTTIRDALATEALAQHDL